MAFHIAQPRPRAQVARKVCPLRELRSDQFPDEGRGDIRLVHRLSLL
jgi:hypothetical protein